MKKSISLKKKNQRSIILLKKNFRKYYLSESSVDFQAVLTIDELFKL